MPFEGKGRIKMRVRLENGITLEFDSAGMMEDFKECEELVERTERNSNEKDEYKNCDTCKCNLYIEGISLCCIPEVARAFKEKK